MCPGYTESFSDCMLVLTYDGFMETNNMAKINNFAEILRYSNREKA